MTTPEKVFPQFKLGAMIFFLGLVVIYSSSQLLHPSIVQEVITLIGLILIGWGFLLSMWSQVRMLTGRILRFFAEDQIRK
ncbi:hypothetical protein AB835_00830 [Candidatus Endobugula sertula]|uniref:Uncharacterized protein n=1 Tax=Candidatus Endobugula sertula TaxID=62101 RepID=A0A1D2QU66_9GAMM|nr:hypothetical protein AB835_00830 [Candidatus Endobugula sertula]